MIYKKGVVRHGLHWRMRFVEQQVDEIWKVQGEEAVMTSGVDGKHGTWSWHYYGCAADFRTRYFEREQAALVADALSAALRMRHNGYQVILHAGSHIHVEFDPDHAGMV